MSENICFVVNIKSLTANAARMQIPVWRLRCLIQISWLGIKLMSHNEKWYENYKSPRARTSLELISANPDYCIFLFYSELENYSLHKNCDFPQAALFDFSTTESSQTEG